MLSLLTNHPLLSALILILIDLVLWRLITASSSNWKLAARVVIFALFSVLLFNEGLNPMAPAPWADNVPLHLAATGLQIGWWLYAARTLTVLLGAVMMQRVGHTGRLLQDLLGAVIFLIAVIAALAYVLELPVKGVLATSGALAIVVGLALQSTLSDVFSGIVLNTTKPYQLGDWISIDGTEGRVTDIDWRATRLQTSQGSMAVIPNSLAAKAKIINFSRPSDIFGVSISLQVSPHARPQTVIDALERAMQGCRFLLDKPAPCVALKAPAAPAWSMKSAASWSPWIRNAWCAICCSTWRSGTCRHPASSCCRTSSPTLLRPCHGNGRCWTARTSSRPCVRKRKKPSART